MPDKQCCENKQCCGKSPVALIMVAVVVVLAFLIYPGASCKQGVAADNDAASTECAPAINLPEGVTAINFASGVATIQSKDKRYTVQIELAETEEQFTRGLMYRESLGENRGMLFIFPYELDGGFWMYNMRFPLSIAFMDKDGVILEITDMEPCTSPYEIVCDRDTYYPKRQYAYVLEMNKGYFVRHKIQAGDRISYTRH